MHYLLLCDKDPPGKHSQTFVPNLQAASLQKGTLIKRTSKLGTNFKIENKTSKLGTKLQNWGQNF